MMICNSSNETKKQGECNSAFIFIFHFLKSSTHMLIGEGANSSGRAQSLLGVCYWWIWHWLWPLFRMGRSWGHTGKTFGIHSLSPSTSSFRWLFTSPTARTILRNTSRTRREKKGRKEILRCKQAAVGSLLRLGLRPPALFPHIGGQTWESQSDLLTAFSPQEGLPWGGLRRVAHLSKTRGLSAEIWQLLFAVEIQDSLLQSLLHQIIWVQQENQKQVKTKSQCGINMNELWTYTFVRSRGLNLLTYSIHWCAGLITDCIDLKY